MAVTLYTNALECKRVIRGCIGRVEVCTIDSMLQDLKAIKTISRSYIKDLKSNKDKAKYKEYANIIAKVKKISHPNLVKIYDIIDDEKSDKMGIVMEYIDSGNLQSKIQSGLINAKVCWSYFRGLLLGLECCHNQGVWHKLITAGNVLLDASNNVKISELGVGSLVLDYDDRSRVLSYHYYMAPEVCMNTSTHNNSSDVWALGVLLFYMITGSLPFNGSNIYELFHDISNSKVRYPECITPTQKDLLDKMLEKEPACRITIPEIKAHPWVTHNGALQMPLSANEIITLTPHEIRKAFTIIKSTLPNKSIPLNNGAMC